MVETVKTAVGEPNKNAVPTLACRALSVGHGPLTVARDIDMSLHAGTVMAILGPNGAGKSTLLNTIAGILPRQNGEVLLNGTSLRSGKPAMANKSGVVLVPDDRALFTKLTVRENLHIATTVGARMIDEMMELFPALRDRLKVAAGALSGGEQQMLAMARALVQKPQVLLVDEMSMGLAPVIVEGLLPIVRRVADESGAVVILVEQHVNLALEVADQAVVLVHGSIKLAGSAEELARDRARLEAAYLART